MLCKAFAEQQKAMLFEDVSTPTGRLLCWSVLADLHIRIRYHDRPEWSLAHTIAQHERTQLVPTLEETLKVLFRLPRVAMGKKHLAGLSCALDDGASQRELGCTMPISYNNLLQSGFCCINFDRQTRESISIP